MKAEILATSFACNSIESSEKQFAHDNLIAGDGFLQKKFDLGLGVRVLVRHRICLNE